MADVKIKKSGLRGTVADALKNEEPVEVTLKLKFPSKRIMWQIAVYFLIVIGSILSAVFFSVAEGIVMMIVSGFLVLAIQSLGWLTMRNQKPILGENQGIIGFSKKMRNICVVAMSACLVVSLLLATAMLLDIKVFMTALIQHASINISLGVIILVSLINWAGFVFVSKRRYILSTVSTSILCFILRYIRMFNNLAELHVIRKIISDSLIAFTLMFILCLIMSMVLIKKRSK